MFTRDYALRLAAPSFGIVILMATVVAAVERPLHEREASAAWEAFVKRDYAKAIAHAEKCIDEFEGAAARRQKELDAKMARVPNGFVDARQKDAIHQNGVLNDVAASFYIVGRASDSLGKKEKSAQALAQATKLPSARVWDPRGWFWSPAEAAQRYLISPELADKAPHEIYTADAWSAYNRGAYAQAIVHADKCLNEFHAAAAQAQADLARSKTSLPTGRPTAKEKEEVLKNGLLNDVSCCLFIKGKSAEALDDKRTAAQAYRDATKLPLGRCWDPNGWFWSPAEVSGDRLATLR